MRATPLIVTNGCSRPSTASRISDPKGTNVGSAVQGQEPPTVLFDIKRQNGSSGPGGLEVYDCTYRERAKTAMFRHEFRHGPMSGEIPMARAEGKFLAVAGSENSALLEDLMKALEAKRYPARSPRTVELAFDAVVLGERQSRNSSADTPTIRRATGSQLKSFCRKAAMKGRFSSI